MTQWQMILFFFMILSWPFWNCQHKSPATFLVYKKAWKSCFFLVCRRQKIWGSEWHWAWVNDDKMFIFGQYIPKHSATATASLSAETVLQFCLHLVIKLDQCSPFSTDLSPSLHRVVLSINERVTESLALTPLETFYFYCLTCWWWGTLRN